MIFKPGDLVWYKQTSKKQGEGCQRLVPGIYVGLKTRRVTITIFLTTGEAKNINVNVDNLTPRKEASNG